MPLLTQRILRGLKPAAFNPGRPPALREHPEKIILGVRPGQRPCAKAPVRIYLGTERGQFRAERIFLWSIEKHRDPSRIYEIYLLRDLKGFQRRFWLTGFTNYRFAIPAFANYQGRAIYNDADQVYLKDPALLFDTPMGEAGFLSINDRDTSVMLIDCQRMRDAWNAADVRQMSRKALEQRARQGGLWGELDGGWNARDSEYHPQRSHLVHFTTLHTQPWRPFPDELVYFDNPTDPLWHDLEHEADQAGFLPVSARRPSENWQQACANLPGETWRTLLAPDAPSRGLGELTVSDVLERIPDPDVAWVLERLFSLAGHLHIDIREPLRHRPGRTRRSAWYWLQQLEAASRLHPRTRWSLIHSSPFGVRRHEHGGPARPGPVQVLIHRKPGHNNQARAIAEKLAELSGRPLVEIPIEFSETAWLLRRLVRRGPPEALDSAVRNGVLVAGGWLPCQIARMLQRRNPSLRLVLSGRKGGKPTASGSVAIQCRHFELPPHPRRLQTLLPLNSGRSDATARTERWSRWLAAERKLALLVGGDSRSHELATSDATKLAAAASKLAAEQQARLLVVTGRRSANVLDALQDGLVVDDLLYRWQANDAENPYALALTEADLLIVTGESESMLADAASCEQPFMIWPTRARRPGLWQRFSAAVTAHATRPRINRRGSIRPQQGSTYLCARALEREWILPPRRIEGLHDLLYARGLAAPFGDPLPHSAGCTVDELHTTVLIAARHLGVEIGDPPTEFASELEPHEQRHEHS